MTSEQAKHSPLPWTTSERHVVDATGSSVGLTGFSVPYSPESEVERGDRNTAFVLEAVNSHAVLVEALRAALLYLIQKEGGK